MDDIDSVISAARIKAIRDLEAEVEEMKAEVKEMKDFFKFLSSPESSQTFLEEKLVDFPRLHEVIDACAEKSDNRERLGRHVKEQTMRLDGKQKSLLDLLNTARIKMIGKLEAKVDKLKAEVEEMKAEVKEMKAEGAKARAFFEFLLSPEYSQTFLEEKLVEFPMMRRVIDVCENKSENTERLARHVKDQETRLKVKLDRLDSRRKALMESLELLISVASPSHDGIKTSAARSGSVESGLSYNLPHHDIEFDFDDNAKIRIAGVDSIYRVDTGSFEALFSAWQDPADEGFELSKCLKTLAALLPKLDPNSVANAWQASQMAFKICDSAQDTMGEMTFQQLVYTPFIMLFMAAAGGCHDEKYAAADQMVTSSLSVECCSVVDGDYCQSKVSIKPDSAVTLAASWDAFGMMGMRGQSEEYRIDMDKCILMTAITAIVLKRCMAQKRVYKEKDYAKIALPFVISTGKVCSFYVTTLDKHYDPFIQMVGYPSDGNFTFNQDPAINVDCGKSPSDERKNMFVAMAVLLNKFKEFFDCVEDDYKDYVRDKQKALESFKSIPFSKSLRSEETAAMQAAACGGKFCDLEYPFERFLRFTDSGAVLDKQEKSPFYFKCRSVSSDIGPPGREVFLKVWQVSEEDTDSDLVESEGRYHRIAFEAGVPVAAPALPGIAKSWSVDGSEYLVYAVDYIQQDYIRDPMVFRQFCCALIDTVTKLHLRAGLLHCDLKPRNIRWSKGDVKLIDFEHAQSIADAMWRAGTEGYEAPEILNRLPNSTKTDAFSVGRIILTILEKLEDQQDEEWMEASRKWPACIAVLRQVAENLTDTDPESRWSLARASKELQASQPEGKVATSFTSSGKPDDSSSPPYKIAK